MPRISRIVLVLTVLLACSWCAAQVYIASGQAPTLNLNRAMTARQFAECGLDKLDSRELASLEAWFSTVLLAVRDHYRGSSPPVETMPLPAPPPAAPRGTVSRRHWVDKVSRDGSLVTLDDKTVWLVAELDRIYTQIWLGMESVYVIDGDRMLNANNDNVVGVRRVK